MTWSDWFALGSLAVAVAALAQPWLISWWQKKYKPGHLDIYFSGFPEIGYSEHGPTLTVGGTIAAVNRDVFVERISVEITRVDTHESHEFSWVAFKGMEINLSRPQDQVLSLPFGIMVTTTTPHRFSIFFADRKTQAVMLPHAQAVRDEGMKLLRENRSAGSGRTRGHDDIAGAFERVESQLSNSQPYRAAFSALHDTFYWKAGKYKLALKVSCARPTKIFERVGRFTLSDSDQENLKNNVVVILNSPLRALADLPEWPHNFATPDLVEESSSQSL